MDITRFDKDMDGSMEPAEHGRWVRFEDHSTAIDDLARQAAKSERRAIEFGDIVHRHVLVMQAAVIDASLGRDGLAWIRNTLFGPGHYPDIDAAREMGGAQAYFDAKVAEHEAFRAAHPAPASTPPAAPEQGALTLARELNEMLWSQIPGPRGVWMDRLSPQIIRKSQELHAALAAMAASKKEG